MKRIPFEQVDIEVVKLYDFSLKEENEINERCDFIRSFIESCGWTVDDYVAHMMGWASNKLN